MFRSNKKVEAPTEISIQAIEEDLQTFTPSLSHSVNKQRIIEDIKCEIATNDMDTSLWFNFFSVFQSQQRDLQDFKVNMQKHKEYLESKKCELESQKEQLQKDIEECLKNVRKAKSPQ